MQPEKLPLAELINKYLNGACSPEEETLLFKWMNQLDLAPDQLSLQKDMGEMLKLRIDKANGMGKKSKTVRFFRPVIYAAASIFIAAAAGLLFDVNGDRHHTEPSLSRVIVHQHFKKLINNGNAPARVKLEDGSEVNLQTGSSLLWEVPFSKSIRKIELTGQAFFEVAKNKHKPFIVFSGDISTTALGTSFWVKEKPGMGEIEVELVTGKVVIKHYKNGLSNTLAYLNPGQQLVYNLSNTSAIVSNTTSLIARKPLVQTAANPALVFTSTPLTSVFTQLQSYYHIKIEYNPQLIEAMTFYGTYTEKDDVKMILNTIVNANGLVLKKSNNTFIISD